MRWSVGLCVASCAVVPCVVGCVLSVRLLCCLSLGCALAECLVARLLLVGAVDSVVAVWWVVCDSVFSVELLSSVCVASWAVCGGVSLLGSWAYTRASESTTRDLLAQVQIM